ncbi:hypothetical protein OIU91_04205 [Streptomyces sp. NBC_01456]|uniref:hypothetical protein n=1 Tax=unclassified Streptomyces TaxID=2593676 RepID=UPI002E32D838|nr:MULTISPECIES: hypothetical protein [unclassified Streptomyces]
MTFDESGQPLFEVIRAAEAETEAESTPQAAPVDAAEQSDEKVAVLQRVRETLGPDPRVTQLEARVAELETEVAQQKQRADEANARLTLIHEAFHA